MRVAKPKTPAPGCFSWLSSPKPKEREAGAGLFGT